MTASGHIIANVVCPPVAGPPPTQTVTGKPEAAVSVAAVASGSLALSLDAAEDSIGRDLRDVDRHRHRLPLRPPAP